MVHHAQDAHSYWIASCPERTDAAWPARPTGQVVRVVEGETPHAKAFEPALRLAMLLHYRRAPVFRINGAAMVY